MNDSLRKFELSNDPYVEDIMGPICFDYGFGPFRWVCSSGNDDDLAITDEIASRVLRSLADEAPSSTSGDREV